MNSFLNRIANLTLFILLGTIALSCDNDDDPVVNEPSLEGRVWVQTAFDYVDCNEDDLNGGNPLECDDQFCQSVLFDNGIARYTEVLGGDSETFDFPYTLIGDDRFSVGGFTATYDITNSILTISSDDPSDGCTLIDTYEEEG